ncbi:MAG: hypothetical protein NDJ90_11500 [Oligoflexia bacterium]|nr:hypothetical protein [Oligoflexia bacterium]
MNTLFEAAARATFEAFGFNPTAILSFEMSPASDLYISPKLPGAKDWYYLKAPAGEEALIFNPKTREVLLVESEDTWSEKTQKSYSKIKAADKKAWKELTGADLVTKATKATKAKPAKKSPKKKRASKR